MGGSLYDNLIDARCSEKLCERCGILAKRGQTAQMLFLLRGHITDQDADGMAQLLSNGNTTLTLSLE